MEKAHTVPPNLPQPMTHDRLTGEAFVDPEPDYRLAFESLHALGAFEDAAEAEAMTTDTVALWWTAARLATELEFDSSDLTSPWGRSDRTKAAGINMLAATTNGPLHRSGLSAATVSSILSTAIQGADILGDYSAHLHHETQGKTGSLTPLSDRLRAMQLDPIEVSEKLYKVYAEILLDSAEIAEHCAYGVASLINQANPSLELDGSEIEERCKGSAPRIHGIETLIEIIRSEHFTGIPRVDFIDVPAVAMKSTILNFYKKWKTAMGPLQALTKCGMTPMEIEQLRPGAPRSRTKAAEQSAPVATQAGQATPEAETNGPSQESISEKVAAELAGLRAELVQLATIHSERSKAYRPSWSKLKEAFRGLELALKSDLPAGGHEDSELNQSRRRLIGLMTVFAELGAGRHTTDAQEELAARLADFFSFERTISIKIRQGQRALRAAGMDTEVNGWLPVEPDAAMLQEHWAALQLHVMRHWPHSGGAAANAGITNTLRAFDICQRELTDPEHHLKTVAIHLGATVLRPESRGQGNGDELGKAQRRQAFSSVLGEIIGNEGLRLNDRQRAQVLKHFLLRTNQTQDTKGATYSELFYIPQTKEQLTPYFCTTFQSDGGKPWILIESLRYGKASYIFPKKLIDQQGMTLDKFLDTYNKNDLRRLGGIKVIHSDGWTAESHIEEIGLRIKAVEMAGRVVRT